MIDAFYIFTKGGLLLWSTQLVKVKGDPLDRLIKEVLMQERMGETFVTLDSYSLKWKLLNEMDLFFVVVYQGILQMPYLEGLLEAVAKKFLDQVVEGMGRLADVFGNGLSVKRVDFDKDFKTTLEKVDNKQRELRRGGAGIKNFADTSKGKEITKKQGGDAKKGKAGKDGEEDGDDGDDGDGEGEGEGEAAPGLTPAAKRRQTVPKAFVKKEKAGKPPADAPADDKSKKSKQQRVWDSKGKVTSKVMTSLDHSKTKDLADLDDDDPALLAKKKEFLGSGESDVDNEDDIASLSSDSGEDVPAEKAGRVGGLFKSLTKSVKNLTGGAVLTEEDLQPLLKQFKTALMTRNVAAEVTDRLADSVRTALVGKKTDKFTSMSSTVRASLVDAMETLLTPKKSIDILRAAMAAKNAGRVYTIVFLGVNGVGKSTNLAKVAYYLKHKGNLDVLICACDTFRAGAVEQLKTHSRCLDVPLFERGYGKDPAEIAKASIAHARQTGADVVLVDTAGRMQDNEPLMRALAKLVSVNSPDLVLFVGEALVGNDAIDQVTKFNRSLIDMSLDARNPRGIDGMLLTKYDTVDDKVGAALSMVYVTGQPIVFVGCGQKYTHLRKLNVKEVCHTLLS